MNTEIFVFADWEAFKTDYRYDNLGHLWQVQPDVEIGNTRAPNTEYGYDEEAPPKLDSPQKIRYPFELYSLFNKMPFYSMTTLSTHKSACV